MNREPRRPTQWLGLEETVDEAGRESFPASDPPSWSATHLGPPSIIRGAPEPFHDVAQRIRDDVRLLSETIGERNTRSSRAFENLTRAAEAIEGRFRDAELPVRRRPIDELSWNVEAVIRGGRLAEESVVVGAHYDSARRSPGADDNASGVAMLIALAHSLQAMRHERTVRLVAFAAEEPPHASTEAMGSAHYLDALRREGPRVSAMMSVEAVGVYAKQPHAWPFRMSRLLRSDIALVGDRTTRDLLERAKRAFESTTSDVAVAAVTFPLLFATVRTQAHEVFARAGVPAFMVTGTAPLKSIEYHRETDTAGLLDYDCLGVTSIALRRIVTELAGTERTVV